MFTGSPDSDNECLSLGFEHGVWDAPDVLEPSMLVRVFFSGLGISESLMWLLPQSKFKEGSIDVTKTISQEGKCRRAETVT